MIASWKQKETFLRDSFLLQLDVVFLNHGSFGTRTRPALGVAVRVGASAGRVSGPALHDAREALGAFVGADADDLVYIPNATTGLNVESHPYPNSRATSGGKRFSASSCSSNKRRDSCVEGGGWSVSGDGVGV